MEAGQAFQWDSQCRCRSLAGMLLSSCTSSLLFTNSFTLNAATMMHCSNLGWVPGPGDRSMKSLASPLAWTRSGDKANVMTIQCGKDDVLFCGVGHVLGEDHLNQTDKTNDSFVEERQES